MKATGLWPFGNISLAQSTLAAEKVSRNDFLFHFCLINPNNVSFCNPYNFIISSCPEYNWAMKLKRQFCRGSCSVSDHKQVCTQIHVYSKNTSRCLKVISLQSFSSIHENLYIFNKFHLPFIVKEDTVFISSCCGKEVFTGFIS